jgi:hypothetical protein
MSAVTCVKVIIPFYPKNVYASIVLSSFIFMIW